MGRIETTRDIHAPVEQVFDTIAHIENFQKAIPDIVRVEFDSEQKRGKGTRFRETRRMGKREATVALEVTDYQANDKVRIVSDAGGTIWDTTFTVKPLGEGKTRMTMAMDDKAYKLMAKLFVPLIRPMVRKHIEKDMDAVKVFCEQG